MTPLASLLEAPVPLAGAGSALAFEGFDGWGLRQLFDRSHEQVGLDRTIADVIGPALARIDGREKRDPDLVAQDHLFGSAAERWLRSRRPAAPPTRAPLALLACGPGETGTLALFALETLLARRGWAVENLGSATPATSLRTAVRVRRPAAVVVVAHRDRNRTAAAAALAGIADLTGTGAVFYGGGAFGAGADGPVVTGTYFGADFAAAATLIAASRQPAT